MTDWAAEASNRTAPPPRDDRVHDDLRVADRLAERIVDRSGGPSSLSVRSGVGDRRLDAADCHAFDLEPAHSLFSVDYLAALTGVLPDDDPVALTLDEDAPVTLGYDVADGAGTVQLLVAPRLSAT